MPQLLRGLSGDDRSHSAESYVELTQKLSERDSEIATLKVCAEGVSISLIQSQRSHISCLECMKRDLPSRAIDVLRRSLPELSMTDSTLTLLEV